MDELDFFLPVCLGAFFYSIINIICRLTVDAPMYMDRKARHEYIGQHVSFCHSTLACTLSVVSYVYSNGIDLEAPTDFLQVWVLGLSIGYFIYDSIYAEIYQFYDWPYRIHHILVVVGGICVIIQPIGGAIGPITLFLTELSNPFLEIRLILKGQKKQDTPLYRTSELIFASIFFFNRSIPTTILNYNVFHYDLPWLLKFISSGLYGLGLYWIYEIISVAVKDMKKNEESNFFKVCCIGSITCVRKNKILFCIGICLWSFLVPILLKAANFPGMHVECYGFKII